MVRGNATGDEVGRVAYYIEFQRFPEGFQKLPMLVPTVVTHLHPWPAWAFPWCLVRAFYKIWGFIGLVPGSGPPEPYLTMNPVCVE